MPTPTLAHLKQAVAIAEQIEKLQTELAGLVGGNTSVASAPTGSTTSPIKKRSKRTMSPAARAKIGAAQKARWAKLKATGNVPVAAPKKKRRLSPEGRARIVAAAKARWAKKAGK